MTKIIELRPNANLINHNFDKYQFSSDAVSVKVQKSLTKDVYRQEPTNSQDSWLEARLFAFHNHLFKNPFDASCWFVDESRDVYKLNNDGNLELIRRLSAPENNVSMYNPSMAFASAEIIILSNGGANSLDIWIDGVSIKECYTIDEADAGVILDARYIQEKSKLVIAMCAIVQVDGKKCSQLTILSYKHHPACEKPPMNSLIFLRKQVFNVKGSIEYAYIEATGDFIHTMSQDTAVFAFDSEKTAEPENVESIADTEIKIPKYYWSQDEDSLTVWLKIPENNREDRANIDVTSGKIVISIKDTVLMQGDSQHRLDPELTTWKHEGDKLQLELTKFESGLMWNELIKGDTGGESLPNTELAAEFHRRFEHLCTTDPQASGGDGQPMVGFNAEQLEECDLEGKDNFLQRINLNEHSTTHLVMLGTSNRLLFTHKLQSGQVLCLRHDHHGIIWIPEKDETDEWLIRHVDTFPGFGYVEASKTNKKFCVSPPNRSYVAIVEHAALVLLYEKPKAAALIAKQRIFELDPEAAPIMGATATNKHLILLTKNEIYYLEIFP